MNDRMKCLKLSMLLFVISVNLITAQTFSIKGRVVDDKAKILVGASAGLYEGAKVLTGKIVDSKGNFEIDNIKKGKYELKITFLGFETYTKVIDLVKDINLGEIKLIQSSVTKQEIEVTGQMPAASINKDTTEFNAGAYKVATGSDAEDLIKKMPGVTVDQSGTVTAQGEQVKKVLVDGKEFFGSDPTIALKNLPSDVIDKIQVYDKMSNQAEFTGFDDGNSSKTMNIVTKKNARNGLFGKLTLGGGHESKFIAKGNINIFDGTRRISIIGLSNNVNQQNFAFEDIIGSGGSGGGGGMFRNMQRGGGAAMGQAMRMGSSMIQGSGMGGGGFSDYLVGQVDGINTTHSIGFNYSESWLDAVSLNANYFFNLSNNDGNQNLNRTYYLDTLSNQYYTQKSSSLTENYNHRLNLELNWVIDSSSSVNIKPRFSYQLNDANSETFSGNSFRNILTNSSDYFSGTNSTGLSFSNDLLYRLKLNDSGRTISINLNTKINDKNADYKTDAISMFYIPGTIIDTLTSIVLDTLLQNSKYPRTSNTWGINTTYTEPISSNTQLSLSYNFNLTSSDADKKTYSADSLNLTQQRLDSSYSNEFKNDYLTHRAGVGYRFKDEKMNITLGINYQLANLKNEQSLPQNYKNSYNFDDFLPSVNLNYKFSLTQNLRFNYRTNTNLPSVEQLQNVIDITNPLSYSKGNQDLEQEFLHNISIRYSDVNPLSSNMFFSFISLNIKKNHIANATLIKSKDTIIDNLILKRGVQFSSPINLPGYFSLYSVATYGFPISLISSNINLSLGFGYTRTPGMYNNIETKTNSYNGNFILGLGSNISENLDFNLGSRTSLNLSKNSLNNSQNQSYLNQTTNFKLNYTFWEGIFLQGELNSTVYKGIQDDYNQSITLINLGIGKKFFPDNRLEIKFSVNDLLNQNNAVSRSISELYIENSQTKVLQRYFLLSITYSVKNFGMMGGGMGRPPGDH